MKNQDRTSYVFYILTAFLIAYEGYGLRALHTDFLGGNLFIVLAIVHIFFGLIRYNNGRYVKLTPLVLILVGIIVSIIPANIYWHQSYTDSLLLYRRHIWLFYLPVFCVMRPRMSEIYRAIGIYAIGFFIIWTYQAVSRNLIVYYYDVGLEDGRYSQIFDNEIGFHVGGLQLILLLYYHYLAKVKENRATSDIIIMFLLLAQLLLATSRSMLFFAAMMLVYVVFTSFSKTKNAFITVALIALIGGGLYYSYDIWESLIVETQTQLGDKDYARWLSVDFYLNKFSPSAVCQIIGNGLLSTKTAGGQLIQDMSSYSIYIEDIGLMGNWVQYGILPIIVIYYVVLRMIWTKRNSYPWDVKFLALHIAILPTAWELLSRGVEMVLVFLLYWYVLVESKKYNYERAFN